MRRVPVAVLGVLAALAGCQWIGGVDDLRFSDATSSAGTGGAGGSSSSVGGGGGVASCELAHPPERPTNADPVGDESFVLAVRTMNFGEAVFDAQGNPQTGLDLDDRCTCEAGEPLACTLGNDAALDPTARCDGIGGRDNNLARLFRTLGDAGLDSEDLDDTIATGRFSLLIHVSDYDGSANDPRVTVALYPAGLMFEGACGGGGGGAGGGAPRSEPLWDGSDRWPVPSSAIAWGTLTPPTTPQCYDSEEIAERPRFVDLNGYVADGVLVAGLSGLSFVAVTNQWSLPIDLGQGFLVGALERAGAQWSIQAGTFAGRLPTASVFESVSVASLGGNPICMGMLNYTVLRGQVCALVDLPSGFGGPSAPCDALSYGIEFSAFEADFGGVIPVEELVSQCPPGTDPAMDSCG